MSVIGMYLREVSFKFGRHPHPHGRGTPPPKPPEKIKGMLSRVEEASRKSSLTG
jgi:hypothetical protein